MRYRRPRFQAFVVRLTAAVGAVSLVIFGAPQKGAGPARVQSTDPALRLGGYSAHLEMEKTSPFNTLKWSHIGPVNVSGRCTDIAVVQPKGESYTIYVATASGGVWKTVNEGTTWEPVFERAASTSIGDIALAPSNPDIIWVGTGEANIFRSSQAGVGIFKSTDAGRTWRHMGLDGDLHHCPDRRPSPEPGHRLCRRGRPRVDGESRARRLQIVRRRADLGEGPVHRPRNRRLGPGHGPRFPGHAVRGHLAENPAQVERPAEFPGLLGKRHP